MLVLVGREMVHLRILETYQSVAVVGTDINDSDVVDADELYLIAKVLREI